MKFLSILALLTVAAQSQAATNSTTISTLVNSAPATNQTSSTLLNSTDTTATVSASTPTSATDATTTTSAVTPDQSSTGDSTNSTQPIGNSINDNSNLDNSVPTPTPPAPKKPLPANQALGWAAYEIAQGAFMGLFIPFIYESRNHDCWSMMLKSGSMLTGYHRFFDGPFNWNTFQYITQPINLGLLVYYL